MSELTVAGGKVPIMTTPQWLTFVLRQGGVTPLILIHAPDMTYYDTVRRGLTSLGVRALTPGQLATGTWPAAPLVEVDVSVEGLLARIHLKTKDKSIVPSGEEPMTALWMVAAKQSRKVLVALVPPGSIPADLREEDVVEELGRIAGLHRMYAGLAEFFDTRFRQRRTGLIAAPAEPGDGE